MAGVGAWLALSALAVATGCDQSHALASSAAGASGLPSSPLSWRRWQQDQVTLRVDATFAELDPEFPDSLHRALEAWHSDQASLPEITLDFSSNALESDDLAPDGRNTLSFGRIRAAEHDRDLAITVSHKHALSGAILEADIIVNAEQPWERTGRAACAGGYDLESVLTHELGHFLGLPENTVDASSTMFFVTDRCERHKRSTSPADQTALLELYAAPPGRGLSCAVCAPRVPADGTGLWLGLFALLCVQRARTRRHRPAR